MEEVARVDQNMCVLPQEMMNWGPYMLGELGTTYLKDSTIRGSLPVNA